MQLLSYSGAEGTDPIGIGSDIEVLKKHASTDCGNELIWIHHHDQGIWEGVEQEHDEYFYLIQTVPYIPTSSLYS